MTSEALDGAFPEWFDFQRGSALIEGRGRTKTSSDLLQRSSTRGTSEIYVMLRRPSSQGNGKRKSSYVRGGLMDTLKVRSNRAMNCPRKKEIERFGYDIAEKVAVVRDIRRVSRNYKRDRWAREVVLIRELEGDIERVKMNEKIATRIKRSEKPSSRWYSVFNQESFQRLLVTSSKYMRKDWSKVLHGEQKLKNSMNGFMGKVNEELSENRRKLLTDDDSTSEHSIRYEEAGRTESKEAFKERLALLLWEKNRSTLTPKTKVSMKSTSQEKTHSLYDQLVTTRRKSVAQEAGTQSSAVEKRSDVISNTPESVKKTKQSKRWRGRNLAQQ